MLAEESVDSTAVYLDLTGRRLESVSRRICVEPAECLTDLGAIFREWKLAVALGLELLERYLQPESIMNFPQPLLRSLVRCELAAKADSFCQRGQDIQIISRFAGRFHEGVRVDSVVFPGDDVIAFTNVANRQNEVGVLRRRMPPTRMAVDKLDLRALQGPYVVGRTRNLIEERARSRHEGDQLDRGAVFTRVVVFSNLVRRIDSCPSHRRVENGIGKLSVSDGLPGWPSKRGQNLGYPFLPATPSVVLEAPQSAARTADVSQQGLHGDDHAAPLRRRVPSVGAAVVTQNVGRL